MNARTLPLEETEQRSFERSRANRFIPSYKFEQNFLAASLFLYEQATASVFDLPLRSHVNRTARLKPNISELLRNRYADDKFSRGSQEILRFFISSASFPPLFKLQFYFDITLAPARERESFHLHSEHTLIHTSDGLLRNIIVS